MAGEDLVDTSRMILQCPIFRSTDEGIMMELVQYLLDAQMEKHAVWDYSHSIPWPVAFFTYFPERARNRPVARQGLVAFTIDCRTYEHAKWLLNGLREHLRICMSVLAILRRPSAHLFIEGSGLIGQLRDWPGTGACG